MADIGDVWGDVRANTEPFEDDLTRGLNKAARQADAILDVVGERWGDTLADATSEELGKHGKDFSDAIEQGIRKEKIKVKGEWFTFDAKTGRWRDSMGRFARDIGEEMADEVADAFETATKASKGAFAKIGEAISDAIGAGFNVSGRSPLIALLVPAIGAVALAIVGATQAANGLAAVLTAMPALVAAIGLQVGTLAIAFQGVGTAIEGAFAAKNVTELNEALKGLTPSAQQFVKSLLPVRDMFKDLQKVVQENFFAGLGNSVAPMLRSLIEITKGPFGALARELGNFFAQLANFFDSKVFATFVTTIFPATVSWLQSFGPTFVYLLESLTRMSTVAIPFLSKLGDLLNRIFLKVANRINQAVEDGSLEAWLDRMLVTLEKVAGVFGSVIDFVMKFVGAVDQAGGNTALDKISEFFERLGNFLASPLGIKALEGFINAAIFLTEVLGGLVVVFATLFAGVQVAAEAIVAFFTWIGETAIPWVQQLDEKINKFIADSLFKIGMWFADIGRKFGGLLSTVANFFVNLAQGAERKWNEFIDWVKGLPGRILNAIGDLGNLLWEAGKSIIRGLWNGMKDAWNGAVDWLRGLGSEIISIKGPLDYDKRMLIPAGNAIIGGLEKGMRERVRDVFGLAAEVTNTLASINSMPGLGVNVPPLDAMSLSATQINNMNMGGLHFDGVPSKTEAQVAGRAVAGGMMSRIQQRNVQLAVRSM